MRKPLDDFKVVHEGWFGSDPATYKQFSLKGHHGVDGIASIGAPVYAPEDGLVFMSANGVKDQYTGNNVAGNTIVIKGSKYEHWLLHLDRRLVFAGNQVEEGQLIGYSGNTGFVTGPHLHWGVRPLNPNLQNGYRGFIDPLTLNFDEGETMNAESINILWFLAFGGQKNQPSKAEWIGKPADEVMRFVNNSQARKERIRDLDKWYGDSVDVLPVLKKNYDALAQNYKSDSTLTEKAKRYDEIKAITERK